MKYGKKFFYRLDIVRNYCRVFLVMDLLVLFRVRPMSALFWIGSLLLLPLSVGAFLRCNRKEDIAQFVSDVKWKFERTVADRHTTFGDENIITLTAFSPRRARLARNIGNKMYFPLNYTFVCCKKNDFLEIECQTLSLYEGGKPTDEKMQFTPDSMGILLCAEDPDDPMEDSDYRYVRLCRGEQVLYEFYVRNDHAWEHFLKFCGGFLTVKQTDRKLKPLNSSNPGQAD